MVDMPQPQPPTAATASLDDALVDLAVIGGSGLASLPLQDPRTLAGLRTPFGPVPEIVIGSLGGHRVGFLPRHGVGHRTPPHLLDSRAQLWTLARLGARVLVSTNAVGGLDPAMRPGDLALTDQLLDRTWGRRDTFFDGSGPGGVQHLPFADPYSEALRGMAVSALDELGERVHPRATSVVIQGPRFATRAEADWHRSLGAAIVNMTQLPEAALAAELGLAHVNLAIITDTDTEHGDDAEDSSVTAERVFALMREAQPRLTAAITAILEAIPAGYSEPPVLGRDVVDALLTHDPDTSWEGT